MKYWKWLAVRGPNLPHATPMKMVKSELDLFPMINNCIAPSFLCRLPPVVRFGSQHLPVLAAMRNITASARYLTFGKRIDCILFN